MQGKGRRENTGDNSPLSCDEGVTAIPRRGVHVDAKNGAGSWRTGHGEDDLYGTGRIMRSADGTSVFVQLVPCRSFVSTSRLNAPTRTPSAWPVNSLAAGRRGGRFAWLLMNKTDESFEPQGGRRKHGELKADPACAFFPPRPSIQSWQFLRKHPAISARETRVDAFYSKS